MAKEGDLIVAMWQTVATGVGEHPPAAVPMEVPEGVHVAGDLVAGGAWFPFAGYWHADTSQDVVLWRRPLVRAERKR